MNSRSAQLLFILLLSSSSLFASELGNSNALDFITIPLDAVHQSLGGAGSLSPSEGTGHWGNPALLTVSGKPSVGAAVTPYMADIVLAGATGSFVLPNKITIAPSFRYLAVGEIDGTDISGDELATSISPFGLDISTAVSYPWSSEFNTGAAIRYVYEYLSPEIESMSDDASASAIVFDGGLYFTPNRSITLSAGFRNCGFFVNRYENDDSDLPASVYSGFRYTKRGNIQSSIQIEVEKEHDVPLTFRPGFEIELFRKIFAIRGGTAFSTDDVSQFFSGLSVDDESFENSKTEPQLFSIGAGIAVPVKEQSLYFDFATKVLGDGMGVNLFFSGGFSF